MVNGSSRGLFSFDSIIGSMYIIIVWWYICNHMCIWIGYYMWS